MSIQRGTEFGASLAANYFDELTGEVIREAVDELGNQKFEKLMLLALPTADLMDKEDILWHLSQVGSDASVPALVKEVISRPSAVDAWEQTLALVDAANALICIGTEESINAVLGFLKHDLWDIRLLGIMVLLEVTISGPGMKAENYNSKLAQCWLRSKRRNVRIYVPLGNGKALYTKNTASSFNGESFSIQPVVDKIICQLPGAELRLAARNMLNKERETEFASRVLGDFGTAEDLPSLHAKLNNRAMHDIVKKAMEQIQERTN